MNRMMTNIELFCFSGKHPEPIIDPYYNRDMVVIPPTADQTNDLVEKNGKLIELVSVFNYFLGQGKKRTDDDLKGVVLQVIAILDSTKGINFSPFSQFFMVYNSSYNSYMGYSQDEKIEFVYEMLELYCKERHAMYSSHGYTNSILQVICDNYSHKRNSRTTLVKIGDILNSHGFSRIEDGMLIPQDLYYFESDKTGKRLFRNFVKDNSLELVAAKTDQNKLPDMVMCIHGHFYIAEMKIMKGSGGGQDKQLAEIINFIRYAESNPKIHYLTYLDGEYSNLLHGSSQPKIRLQYEDALRCLRENPGNYFLNTAGFKLFIKNLLAGQR